MSKINLLLAYVARMSKFWPSAITNYVTTDKPSPGDIAISAAYFPRSQVTLAVVYGYQPKPSDQENDIKNRLQNAGTAANHPLLMMGIFAEHQRTVLADFVKKTITQCVQVSIHLSPPGSSPRFIKKALNLKFLKQLQALDLTSNELIKEVNAAKRQVSKMIRHSHLLLSGPHLRNNGASRAITRRFTERLLEINVEYEEMIQRTRLNFDQLKHTMEAVSRPEMRLYH